MKTVSVILLTLIAFGLMAQLGTISGDIGPLASYPVAFPSTKTTATFCGSRTNSTMWGTFKLAFDSKYDITCNPQFKSDGVTEKWDIYTTNGGQATTTADGGAIAKVNVTAPIRVASGGALLDDASAGNPSEISKEGYFLFEAQTSGNNPYDPGEGSQYELWGCKALPCTPANSAKVFNQTLVRALGGSWASANIVGGLDPHFVPWNSNQVGFSVIESCVGGPCLWSIYLMTIDWTGAAPVLTGIVGRWVPGNRAAEAVAAGCMRYYKLSGFSTPDGGVTTIAYTQASQVSWDGNLYTAEPSNAADPCYALGFDLRQSGTFSFTMNNPPSGSNWTQLSPPAGMKIRIRNGEYNAYTEFPVMLWSDDQANGGNGGNRMTNLGYLIVMTNIFSGQFGIFHSSPSQAPNEANKHGDWALIDPTTTVHTPITNYDVPGSGMYTLVSVGGLAAGAHPGWNATTRQFATRIVSAGIPDRVIIFPFDYVGNPLFKGLKTQGRLDVTGKVGLVTQ